MLFRNDLFRDDYEVIHRLLHADCEANRAWAINMENPLAWPKEVPWSMIADRESVSAEHLSVAGATPRLSSQASPAQRRRADKAWERITPLVAQIPDIFDSRARGHSIETRATELPCSEKTLFNNLREYWRGGQTKEALLGNYSACGRKIDGAKTSNRGSLPKHNNRPIYQLAEADLAHFTSAIKNDYLKDERRSIPAAFKKMLSANYVAIDGNNKSWILPEGQRPTQRQFEYHLRTQYSLEVRLRSRKGDKDFERNHRSKVGTVIQNCLGVGHVYEIDATIADVYLVSSDDPNKIIGKPTLYLIIDRKSRLITGWYIGLENASWIGAMQAILSISSDKAQLCQRYGVKYHPTDWPAHQVFPQEFVGDRGEMLSKSSNQVSEDLQVTVTNLPSLRPDWKPLVECQFKLIHQQVKEVAPAYDPPSNATKRRGKHYEKDACLTLHDFTKIILEAILMHNRQPMTSYDLSKEELHSGVQPSPIDLWTHGVRVRSGLLVRYPEERVRFALLPRAKAVVTENGLFFKGCHYTCPEAISKGWFVKARQGQRFSLDISYDPRLVDAIYIHDTLNQTNYFVATLTNRSEKYAGLSRAEVDYFELLQRKAQPEITQSRLQVGHEFREAVAPTVAAAKNRLKAAGPPKSRSARRADTQEERFRDRQNERQHTAAPMARTGGPAVAIDNFAEVLSLVPKPEPPQNQQHQSENPVAGLSTKAQMKLIREKMING